MSLNLPLKHYMYTCILNSGNCYKEKPPKKLVICIKKLLLLFMVSNMYYFIFCNGKIYIEILQCRLVHWIKKLGKE